jgi:hypothetical protein
MDNVVNYVVERTLTGIKADGETITICAGVGVPYQSEKHDSWACPLKLDGIHKNVRDLHGTDSWQAFTLAQKFIIGQLKYFMEDGGALLMFPNEPPLTLEELHEFF